MVAFDQDLTCLICPLRWAHLPLTNSRKAQWVHLFLMNFNGFQSFRLYFSLKCPFPMIKSSHCGNTIYMRLLSMKNSTEIELFYFDDHFRRIAQWVLAFRTTCSICETGFHHFQSLSESIYYYIYIYIYIPKIRQIQGHQGHLSRRKTITVCLKDSGAAGVAVLPNFLFGILGEEY